MNKIDVVVPILNEGANLPELSKRISASLKKTKTPFSIIFIDDHSNDDTKKIVATLKEQYPISYYLKVGKKGKAYSILQGAKISNAEYIAMLDGDLQYPPEYLPKLLKKAEDENFEVVIGNRSVHHESKTRQIVSKVGNFLYAKLVLGFHNDTQSGMKVFKRELINTISEKDVKPWAFDLPLLYNAYQIGFKIGSVNIDFHDRKNGKSKINFFKTAWEIFSTALRLKWGKQKIYHFAPTAEDSMVGAGMIYKKKTFVTHSTLHHSKSAIFTFTSLQKLIISSLLLILVIGLYMNPQSTLIVFVAILTFIYFLDAIFGLFLVLKSLHKPPEISFTKQEIKNIKDDTLPIYTILSPLYKEGNILPEFVKNIEKIDWPKNKLDVILLLEEDDKDTINAAEKINLPDYIRILVVPESFPKTKPKACNYGLSHAKGEYVVIYDAEDMPEPLQLKKAYLGFNKVDAKVFCLQAKLNYYNPHQNLLTRLFTAEYSLWFDIILPGLQTIDTTIPLGGTSNHFRTADLKKIEGWDSFNVAEDADLGVRLFREGFKTAIIDSITLEEANSDIKNWIRQRSRWIKGYLQTYLVQMRSPISFIREYKFHYFIFQLVSGLRAGFMVINPILWIMTLSYFLLYKFVGPQIEALYPAPVFYMAAFSTVFGNFLYIYYYMIGAAKRESYEIIKYIFFVPFYWILTSVAAFIAFYQLIFRPHYWEKTVHGLNQAESKKQINKSLKDIKLIGLAKQGWTFGGALIFSSMVANVLNFIYSAYLGLTVEITEFGTVSLINSIFAIAAVITSAYGKSISYKTAFLLGKFGVTVRNFTSASEMKAWIASFVMTICWTIAIPFMSFYFKTEGVVPFILFAPAVTVSFISSYYSGVLNGSHRFAAIGFITVVESVAKLLCAFIIIQTGNEHLIYAAVPASTIITFLVLRFKHNQVTKLAPVKAVSKEDVIFPNYFFFTSIITKLWGVSFLSIDILLAKYFLTPFEAGQYALLSLCGKIIYFLGALFSQFINPYISKNEGAGISSKNTFTKIFTLTSVASFGGYLIIGYFGQISAPLLFGDKVLSITYLLPIYGLAIAFYTLTSGIVSYHQIKKHWMFTFVGLSFAFIQVIWMSIQSSNLFSFSLAFSQVVFIQFAVVALLHVAYPKVRNLSSNLKDFLRLTNYSLPEENITDKSRILIFNWRDTRHVWSGGAEVYIHEIAKRLVKKKYSVTVFCGNDGKSPRNEKIDGVQIIRRGGFYTVYLWAFLYYILRLRNHFDIIIDSENGIPFFTPLYSRKKIFLLIHHVHQDMFRMRLKPPLSWIGKYLEKQVMPKVYKNTEVITVSPSSKADILEHKITEKEPKVIYNGVNTKVYKPGVKSSIPMVLYLGRLSKQKSLSVFLQAAKNVLERLPQVEFVIAGDGEDKTRLLKLARLLNLESNIHFTGKVSEDEKVTLYQKAWVFVNPSLMEGWGITTIEANACGTPVIASNVSGLRDAIHNPHSGFLVPYGDAEEFSRHILMLIKNKNMRETMTKDSISWAKKFSWDKTVNQIVELL